MMKDFLKDDVFPIGIYPSKTVKPNDVWTVFSTAEHVIPTNDSCSYYLSEIYGDNIVIKGSGTATSIEDETSNEGIITSYHLKGTVDVTTTFDKNTKWVKLAMLKTEMEGNAEIREATASEKMIVPMKIITEGLVTGH